MKYWILTTILTMAIAGTANAASLALSLGGSKYDIDIPGGVSATGGGDVEDANSVGLHAFERVGSIEIGGHYIRHGTFSLIRGGGGGALEHQTANIQTGALTLGVQGRRWFARTGPAIWAAKISENGGTRRDHGTGWMFGGGFRHRISDTTELRIGVSQYNGINPLDGQEGVRRYYLTIIFPGDSGHE